MSNRESRIAEGQRCRCSVAKRARGGERGNDRSAGRAAPPRAGRPRSALEGTMRRLACGLAAAVRLPDAGTTDVVRGAPPMQAERDSASGTCLYASAGRARADRVGSAGRLKSDRRRRRISPSLPPLTNPLPSLAHPTCSSSYHVRRRPPLQAQRAHGRHRRALLSSSSLRGSARPRQLDCERPDRGLPSSTTLTPCPPPRSRLQEYTTGYVGGGQSTSDKKVGPFAPFPSLSLLRS